MAASSDRGRSFIAGLRGRRAELEEELWNRVRAVQDAASPAEEAYVNALQPTIESGLDYGLEAIERGPSAPPPPVPDTLLLQARAAARTGISLDAVLRRYCAANSLFTDTTGRIRWEEASGMEPPSPTPGPRSGLAPRPR